MTDERRPPRLAVALLATVVPRGWAGDSLMADLDEEFRERAVRGAVPARAWYWRAAVQLAAAYLWDGFRRHAAERGDHRAPDRGPQSSQLIGRVRAPFGSALLQDLRFAIRSFRRTPGFTFLAAITLALGIGSATSVFSVADAVLLRPLPFPRSDRLVHIWMTRPATNEWHNVVAGATYLDWERDAHSFKELAAYRSMDFNVTGTEFPERVAGVSITPGFFRVLGIRPALGRLPSVEDGPEIARNTVVLSDAFWKARYGADPAILGRTLILNGNAHTVVAVLPPGIAFPEAAGLYVPSPYRVPLTSMDNSDRSADRRTGYLSVVGRLADRTGIAAAQAEMRALSARETEASQDPQDPVEPLVVSVQEDLVGHLRPTLVMFLGAVGLLLLIACANVANLLTVRAMRRRRELAVRISLGAGLARIRRQLLTEAVVLAVCGGVPGLLLAIWGTRVLVSLAPDGIPRLSEVTVDPQVLLFSGLITLATGLLFGLAPMVGLSGKTASLTLREGRGRRRPRPELLRDMVIVTEMALALLLVVGAGLMLRTYRVLGATDPGFDPSGLLVAHVALPASKYEEPAAQAAFYQGALSRIRALPGVQSASTILTLPMHWAMRGTFHFSIEGATRDPQHERLAGYQAASSDYFRTLRIPLLRGRGIADTDREDGPGVVVINEAMARRYWPGEDPLG
jgi:putative ABC transport system permease protein